MAKIALKRNISRRFLAGEEGFEPSAYGFGDLCLAPLYPLRRNDYGIWSSTIAQQKVTLSNKRDTKAR